MTAKEISLKLTTKFPSFLKNDADELEDILQFLDKFDANGIESIWNDFRMNYNYSTAPRLAAFNKSAQSCGLSFKESAKSYEFVCYVCGARFTLDKTTCPNCSNHDKAWRAVIRVGAYRKGQLKEEIERERVVTREPVRSFYEKE